MRNPGEIKPNPAEIKPNPIKSKQNPSEWKPEAKIIREIQVNARVKMQESCEILGNPGEIGGGGAAPGERPLRGGGRTAARWATNELLPMGTVGAPRRGRQPLRARS